MKRTLFGMLALAAGIAFVSAPAMSQPPGGAGGRGDKGGQKGGPQKFEIGQILPPGLAEELKLTADQQKELDALKADLKAKLDKLLTDDQKKVVENYRPRGGFGGPGGQGGPGGPGGGKGGGKGGKGGEKPGEKPAEKPLAE